MTRVAELITDIANASMEQARGIEQVDVAVAEMDKAVQKNAVRSENSAASAQELNAQAIQMKYLIDMIIESFGVKIETGSAIPDEPAPFNPDEENPGPEAETPPES